MRGAGCHAHRKTSTQHRRTTSYWLDLDRAAGAWAYVEFTTHVQDVVDYSVVLLLEQAAQTETVRVYDGAHGVNELHRHTRRSGKQPAEVFHGGNLGVGMRVAIEAVRYSYRSMIEGWREQ